MQLEGKLLRWGNSYGIRIRKEVVERLGWHVGDDITFDAAAFAPPVNLDHLPRFDLGDLVDAHDDAPFEAL